MGIYIILAASEGELIALTVADGDYWRLLSPGKKSCTKEKISCTWSMEVLLTREEKLYQSRENKFTG